MSVTTSAIGSALGIAVQSDMDVSAAERAGLPLDARKGLLQLGLTKDEITRHVIALRAWRHRTTLAKKTGLAVFSADESARILRMARVVLRIQEFFGNKENALDWLRTPKVRFEGRTPLEMAETESGAQMIEELIFGVEHGFCA
jgi:putative toxin-antitoxin system antitoxin component (TIGR02293 family)